MKIWKLWQLSDAAYSCSLCRSHMLALQTVYSHTRNQFLCNSLSQYVAFRIQLLFSLSFCFCCLLSAFIMKFSIFNLIAFSRFRYSFALFISTSAIPHGLASIARRIPLSFTFQLLNFWRPGLSIFSAEGSR